MAKLYTEAELVELQSRAQVVALVEMADTLSNGGSPLQSLDSSKTLHIVITSILGCAKLLKESGGVVHGEASNS